MKKTTKKLVKKLGIALPIGRPAPAAKEGIGASSARKEGGSTSSS